MNIKDLVQQAHINTQRIVVKAILIYFDKAPLILLLKRAHHEQFFEFSDKL